jgi:hypothetical protein
MVSRVNKVSSVSRVSRVSGVSRVSRARRVRRVRTVWRASRVIQAYQVNGDCRVIMLAKVVKSDDCTNLASVFRRVKGCRP